MIDHEQDSNADTGLFVKVVPEQLKPIDVDQHADRLRLLKITSTELHQKRMNDLKNRLMAIQHQVTSEEKLTDRYLGYNRESLLMTTVISNDVNVDSTKAAREAIVNDTQSSTVEKIAKLKNIYTLKPNNVSRGGSSAQPDDDQRRR